MTERIESTAGVSQRGSALILAVVLTSLLAMVGVLFVLTSRLDKMATSATTDNRDLSLAVETVVARLSETLAADVPGSGDEEYYDAPDAKNPWLACLEPYAVTLGNDANGTPQIEYRWRQISDGGVLSPTDTQNVPLRVVGEREPIVPGDLTTNADPDGDGMGDAKWFAVPGVMSSKGRPIYAAVRVIDNGAMLNVNTGYRFDPGDGEPNRVDGRSPLQVNLLALGKRGDSLAARETGLLSARGLLAATALDLAAYERQVVWRYPGDPEPNVASPYTPFDLSDELELRYRFLLNDQRMDSRLENWGQFRPQGTLWTPRDKDTQLSDWFRRVTQTGIDPNLACRTIATTYNMDRILLPRTVTTETGKTLHKMVNVNTADWRDIRAAVAAALAEADPNGVGIVEKAVQITANLVDYIDDDDEITVVFGLSSNYYGFERPCLYLSELAYRQVQDPETKQLYTSYAIELYRPYFEDNDPSPGDWKIVIDNPASSDVELDIVWSGSRRFHVLLAEDAMAPLAQDYLAFQDAEEPTVGTMALYGYNPASYSRIQQDLGKAQFEAGATISLQRRARSAGKWVIVDSHRVPDAWIAPDGVARSLQRDVSPNKCLRRLWASTAQTSIPGLGHAVGNYVDLERPEVIQAHPANRPLRNIGELGMVFARNAYSVPEATLPVDALVDLRNPIYRRLFNYLTVIDPAQYTGRDTETRIAGRINVNTAPAFVLAQLPWMWYDAAGMPTLDKAAAVVVQRNSQGVYESIGDLMRVDPLCALALDNRDNRNEDVPRGPDLTPDKARDDFEERDLIFTRISNLVTVRSDVFTAYILVRIGTNGPQKRIVAILDRSQVNSPGDRVRVVARWPVPDPR